ncbi:MAG: hypothetical protein QGI13_17170 [Rhodospirillales bacterium]|nr:hypothetical protein [Rhodospirillales bacterium]
MSRKELVVGVDTATLETTTGMKRKSAGAALELCPGRSGAEG